MASSSSDSADEMISGINITPLVDVVLVLLVVLMVTASFLATQAIPVELPKGRTGEAVSTVLGVSVTKEGALFLDGQRANDEQFKARVHAARKADSEVRAVIAADGGAAHRSVVHVIDLLRQEQVSRFALNVEPEDLHP
jgi:biopolymer transport protein ExbD